MYNIYTGQAVFKMPKKYNILKESQQCNAKNYKTIDSIDIYFFVKLIKGNRASLLISNPENFENFGTLDCLLGTSHIVKLDIWQYPSSKPETKPSRPNWELISLSLYLSLSLSLFLASDACIKMNDQKFYKVNEITINQHRINTHKSHTHTHTHIELVRFGCVIDDCI